MKEVSLVTILNICYVTIFDRFKIDELIEEHGYHHTTAILIPLNWFGRRLKGITTATLVEMGLEWKP
jgi:hypothetical protein